jgi:hypothetical protein
MGDAHIPVDERTSGRFSIRLWRNTLQAAFKQHPECGKLGSNLLQDLPYPLEGGDDLNLGNGLLGGHGYSSGH